MGSQLDFFNTDRSSGEELKQKKAKALSQNEKVLAIIQDSAMGMTASEVHRVYEIKYPQGRAILTSVRRAMSTLASEGKLVKTEGQKMGYYMSKEFIYKIQR